MRIKRIIALLLLAASVGAIEKPSDWIKADTKDTPVLLTVKNGVMTDLVSGQKAAVSGGAVEKDPEMGDVLAFDNSGKGSLSILYQGRDDVLKGKGVTLEAWVKSDQELNGDFFLFFGFGNLSFKNNKLQCNWLNFPTLPIYVEPEMAKKRINYYPMSVGFNGMLPLRKGQWNHIALVYDENGKMVRSWINGGIDRECELMRDGQQFMSLKKGWRLRAFHGLKNVKIAGLRMRAGAYAPGDAPVMKHYLNQLPWQNKMVLTFDKIHPELPLPFEVMAILEGTPDVHTKTFRSREVAHMEIPMPRIWSTTRPLYIKVYAGGKEVYQAVERYNNTPVPKDGKVKINPDKSLSYQGKKMFPIMIYGVVADDLKEVAGLGFTSAGAKDLNCAFYGIPSRDIPMMQKWNKSAIDNRLYLHFGVNFYEPNAFEYVTLYKNLPQMLYWYGADEPWRDWEQLRDNYNFIRSAGGEFPVMSVQCREMHMKNTAPTCDIVGCDPYPVPNVSLRSVAELTRNAMDASFGLKPVWTVLGCYDPKIPNLQELRCMGVIAIATGANGMGIYSWDERVKGKMDRYHASKRPDVVQMLKSFVSDLRALETILVEPNLPVAVSDRSKQPAIHASLKKANGKTYLFLANDQRRPEKAVLNLPDSKFTQAVPRKEFGFQEVLKFRNGTSEITLPALAAGVFELQ